MKKRVLPIFLAALMLLALFAGCNKPDDTTAPPTADTTTTAPPDNTVTDPPPAEAPTLTWWLIGNEPPNIPENMALVNEYIEPIINTKLDIKVAGWGEWGDKVNQIVNTGEAFDIMFTNNSRYSQHVNRGAFLDITDMVPSEAPDLWNFIPSLVWDGAKIGGRIYAVPTYKDSSLTQYWVFDDTYVQKYNIDVANTTTYEALDTAMRAIKAGEGKSVYPMVQFQEDGFNGFFNNYDDMTLGLQPIGVRFDDNSRKVVSVLEQDDIMAGLRQLHAWYKDGIINQDAPVMLESPKNKIFFPAQGFPGAEAIWQADQGVDKYDIVQVFGPLYTTSTIQGSMNAISANSQAPSNALQLLQMVNTDHKLRDMLAYGELGVDFEYVSDNVVKRLRNDWGIGNYAIGTFFVMSTQEGAMEDQWDRVRALNEQATASTILGFAFDLTNVADEEAKCRVTWEKYKFDLINGASDPDKTVPKLIEELKASGMDKIIEEAQRQIDAFFG